MTSFLTFCLPLKEDITEAEIKESAKEWIGDSIWYDFAETSFPEEENENTLIESDEKRDVWFRHFEFSAETGSYIGYRLEKHDDVNRRWFADAVFSHISEENLAYISLDCRLLDPDRPADLSELPAAYRYPRIIKVLKNNHLLGTDCGLSCGNVHIVSEEELRPLKAILKERKALHLPLLYLYLPDNAKLTDGYNSFLFSYLPNIAHVYYALTPQQNQMWHQLLSSDDNAEDKVQPLTPDAYHAQLLIPQLHILRTICFMFSPDQETDIILDQIAGSVMEHMVLCQESLPKNYPSWESIHYKKLYAQTHQKEEPYQISMNEQIADRLHAARRQHRLTQSQLAEKVGVSSLLLSRLERLETIKTKRSLIHDIEKALGLEYGELTRLESRRSDTSAPAESEKEPAHNTDFPLPSDQNSKHNSAIPKEYHFCYCCGAKLAAGSRFCQNCGQKLDE